ncbi:MAG TPA: DNA polymerase III subunit alpha [Candidatus Paceibacterota bacterium]|nr:DNA polymerase III subunit alpha [Candidatus Paceibacterota bacterium]
MADIPFTHLHTHSHYSLLQALPQIGPLVKAAKADGQTALALTDAGALYGAIEFYQKCQKEDIKPIIGVDAYMAPRTRHDKEHRIDNRTSRLVLLAKDRTGYQNLIRLVTASYLEGFYYNPRMDRELLEASHEGLIALVPSFAGETAKALKDGDTDRAHEALAWYRDLFGDDCYQEITMHPEIEGHQELQEQLIALAREMRVPIAAAHDTYYLKPEDALARELVMKIRTGERLDRDGGIRQEDFSFITQKRANELFKELPEALEHTQRIAEACTLELGLGKWVFPDFPIPAGSSYDAELRAKAYDGLEKLGIERTPAVLERIEYELGVIATKGYSVYFLVVSDLLTHAAEDGILTNTRGSAAGSLVSYLAGITTVNPLEYGLPFERFLNPERPSPPDIDMDIADNRRDDLIAYARQKYGTDHVAQIGTFGTMLARAAVRDVARALGHSYSTGDMIAKIIPPPKQGFPVTIASALRDVPELKEIYDSDPDAREIMDLAQKIEGNARHMGIHAAGVVISPTVATDFVPLQYDPKGGKIITQYEMHAVEDAGLLKYDFLGLTNLSVLADAIARVKARLGVDVNIRTIPIDDAKTYAMLSRGETLGVFQFASSGMTSYLVELKPSVIDDLNAMVALYRPGPMAFIPEYIERKRNPARVTYLDPRMEPILKRSYGIITYQDDVLMIAIELSGYTWLEADKFRKAIGKKIPEEMAAQKERFIAGCIERGMAPAVVQALWDQIETFAAYGFNKAHAASYGNLAYKTAYMKANYTVDYMAALLTGEGGDVEKIALVVAECERLGITVLPPSINESRGDFTVSDETTIRFGLYSIKNFGQGISDAIIAERDANGPYADLGDFLARVRDKNLNRKSLEALIQCGALDAFAERGRMLAAIELLLAYHKEHMSLDQSQDSLFGALPAAAAGIQLPDAPPMPARERLRLEKELLGLYVSGHPLDPYIETLKRQKFDIAGTKERMQEGVTTVIGGLLENVSTILTKNGEKMAFGTLADHSGAVEVVAFPRTLAEYAHLFRPEQLILIKGKMSSRNGDKSFVAEAMKELT